MARGRQQTSRDHADESIRKVGAGNRDNGVASTRREHRDRRHSIDVSPHTFAPSIRFLAEHTRCAARRAQPSHAAPCPVIADSAAHRFRFILNAAGRGTD
jgi:hypothetical protein